MSQAAVHFPHAPPKYLQPSAMPRPPPSPAVRSAASVSARLPDAMGKADPNLREGRTVLGRVNVNASATAASAALQKRVARLSPATRSALVVRAPGPTTLNAKHPVPRHAAVADVFGDPPKAQALGKRARADAAAQPVKRSRADPSAVKALTHEQQKWTAMWQRAFPTLTFHFELGTEEGLGRGLRQRAIKLGAVSHTRDIANVSVSTSSSRAESHISSSRMRCRHRSRARRR